MNVGTEGDNWSSSSRGSGTIQGAKLNFNVSNVNALNNTNRGNCYPVRCVQELIG
ncbi:hypothetical protein [Bacteroides sp.]